jgi:hypothetical protein
MSSKTFKVKPDVQFFNPSSGTIGDPVTISGAGDLYSAAMTRVGLPRLGL